MTRPSVSVEGPPIESMNAGYEADTDDDDYNAEIDKRLRNNGFMKGPKYFYPGSGQSGRDGRDCLRRVIFTGDLRAGQTYYVRFKSVLDDTNTQFFFDYLEFVPKIIYNGPIAEDKW